MSEKSAGMAATRPKRSSFSTAASGSPPSSGYRESKGSGLRHVTGQELCCALRELARERWGPLVREVLRSWNIYRTRDFGEMVFFMIELGLMGKQDSDNIADFDDVYDFNEAFGSYTPELDEIDT